MTQSKSTVVSLCISLIVLSSWSVMAQSDRPTSDSIFGSWTLSWTDPVHGELIGLAKVSTGARYAIDIDMKVYFSDGRVLFGGSQTYGVIRERYIDGLLSGNLFTNQIKRAFAVKLQGQNTMTGEVWSDYPRLPVTPMTWTRSEVDHEDSKITLSEFLNGRSESSSTLQPDETLTNWPLTDRNSRERP